LVVQQRGAGVPIRSLSDHAVKLELMLLSLTDAFKARFARHCIQRHQGPRAGGHVTRFRHEA